MTEDSAINYQLISKSLLEALPLPILIVDRTLMIREYNLRSLSLPLQTTQLQGQSLNTLLPDSALASLVQESVASGHVQKGHVEKLESDLAWEVTVTPLTSQATSEIVSTSTSPSLTDASPQYFALIIEDLTETHRLERIQRDFLANISHELRTPLTSVRLLAETLEDVIDTNPDRAQEFVEKIETEVQYLSELVAELLELSRLESGQTIMVIEPVAAERLVREVMARMLPLAQRHRISLGTDIRHGTTLVAADSKQITRVLVNLIHNAIKFTPSFGSVVIGTVTHTDRRMQRFFVRDTGVGISAEELPRVFERFYKTDRARSKAGFVGPGGGGTGLGLAIARHVIESHGGSIWAESTPGNGSTFSFTLPITIMKKQR